jgi:hypothetical protein
MNTVIPPRESKGNASSAWIFRLALGALLIGASIWGIALCRQIFGGSIGPDSVPGDSSFANLGAWASWALFFGPPAIAGVAMVWSTLRNMGALDQFAFWLWNRAGRPDGFLSKDKQSSGLESLSPEAVERLQYAVARAATILGALAGASLLGIGIFGLVNLLWLSRPYAGSSPYVYKATGRLEIAFAGLSGMLIFLGFTILQRAFRRDNNGWLLPLRLFTSIIVRRRAGERTGHTEQHPPGTKPRPRV